MIRLVRLVSSDSLAGQIVWLYGGNKGANLEANAIERNNERTNERKGTKERKNDVRTKEQEQAAIILTKGQCV